MDKNKSIQAIRAIIYFSIVAFHFGLTGTEMMWGGWSAFLYYQHII